MTTIEKMNSPVVLERINGIFDVVKIEDVSEEVVGRLVLISSSREAVMGYCEGHLATAALDVLGVMKYQGNIPEITRFINSQFTWLIAFRGALFARVKGIERIKSK